MARIYRRTDQIPVKIDGITVKVSPLTVDQKTEVQQAVIVGKANGNIPEATRGVVLALKYAVKGLEGVEDANGPYQLQFDTNGHLTDECVADLLNLEMSQKLTLVCIGLVSRIPDEFTDNNGNKLEGVEIIRTSNPTKNS